MSRKPDDEKPAISVWMARARKDLGVSVESVAGEAGYSVSALRKVEGGSNPTPSRALVTAVFQVLRRLGAENGIVVVDPPGAAPRERPGELDGLLEAMAGQTAAISSLAEAIARRGIGVAEPAAVYGTDVDEATKRRRRVYWMERAAGKPLTVAELERRMGWPGGHESQLKSWLQGALPRGEALVKMSHGLNLPTHVLTDPPGPTDEERLAVFRQEALAELPEPEQRRQERQRRTA